MIAICLIGALIVAALVCLAVWGSKIVEKDLEQY